MPTLIDLDKFSSLSNADVLIFLCIFVNRYVNTNVKGIAPKNPVKSSLRTGINCFVPRGVTD